MRVITPSYYEAFACAASRCPDTCCKRWEVVVDEETLARYERLPGPLGDRVRAHLRRDEEGDCFLAFSDGGCPMLRSDGLCSLQYEFGAEALSRVCGRYPRFRYEFGARVEEGVSLSCPTACRLILSTPFALRARQADAPPSLNDIDPGCYYAMLRGREIAFRLAEDRRFPVRARMAQILRFGAELEASLDTPDAVLAAWSGPKAPVDTLALPAKRDDFSRLKAVFLGMEALDPGFPAQLAACNACPPLADSEAEERLLQYFLYKYFLQAAYDGRLLKKLQLCAASLLLCGALCAEVPAQDRDTLADRLHRYSREVEHSEENLARFYRWAGVRQQGRFARLLR